MNYITTAFRHAALTLFVIVPSLLHGAEKNVLKEDFDNVTLEAETGSIRSETSWYGFTEGGGRLPGLKQVQSSGFAGNVLDFSGQSQYTLLVGAFPLVELKKAGDFVQLSLNFRYVYPLKHVTPAFVIGLYASNGTPLTEGNLRKNLPPGSAGSNHIGYRLAKLPQGTSGDLQLDLAQGLGATFPNALLTRSSSGLELTSREMHSLVLNVTLTEDGNIALNYNLNGIGYQFVTTSAAQVGTTRFDEVYISPLGRGFQRPAGNNYIQISNVRVITGTR